MAADFSIGAIIWQSILTLRRNLIAFVGISCAFVVVSIVGRMGVDAILAREESTVAANLLGAVVNLAVSYLATAALVQPTVEDLAGGRPRLDRIIRRLPTSLGAAAVPAVLMGIGVLGGLSFFIIPGLFLATLWYVAIPSAVVEGHAGAGALRRSTQLTDGRRWQVFSLLIAVSVLVLSVMLASSVLIGASAQAGARIFPLVVLVLAQGVVGAFGAVTATVCYHDLRALREGASSALMLRELNRRPPAGRE